MYNVLHDVGISAGYLPLFHCHYNTKEYGMQMKTMRYQISFTQHTTGGLGLYTLDVIVTGL